MEEANSIYYLSREVPGNKKNYPRELLYGQHKSHRSYSGTALGNQHETKLCLRLWIWKSGSDVY